MPLHPEAVELLELMEQRGAPPFETQTPAEARAARAALAPPVFDPCGSTRDLTLDLDHGSIPARLYRPAPEHAPTGLLVWFHGGGWVVGDLESHDNVCHTLARRSGQPVLSVAYRLAPESPFPGGLEDCLAATAWAAEHARDLGVDAARIAIGGDSAGANLAAVVAQRSDVPVRLQVLVYPVTDARMRTESYDENATGYFLTSAAMRYFAGHYLSGPDGSPSDPRVSPLLADDALVERSAPAVVVTAGFDPLRDEGVAYAERMTGAGIPVAHLHFPGQIHGFFSFGHLLSDARVAHAAVAEAVADALSG